MINHIRTAFSVALATSVAFAPTAAPAQGQLSTPEVPFGLASQRLASVKEFPVQRADQHSPNSVKDRSEVTQGGG